MFADSFKLTAAIAIFITSLLALIYPLKIRAQPGHKPVLELADAFASGVFLGTALFHLLPEATGVFQNIAIQNSQPVAEIFCGLGFLVLLFLERLSGCQPSEHLVCGIPLMLAGILIIHALVEGTALGISTSSTTTSMLFIAILAHKGSESFALAVILNQSNLSIKNLTLIAGLFALMTPIGIGIGVLLTKELIWHDTSLITAGFSAFAAGTFLYMSTLHHINHHHHHHHKENLNELWCLTLGLLLMAALTFVSHHH